MEIVSGYRAMNLVAYSLALVWIIAAAIAWNYGNLQTVRLFKICAIPVGIVICAVVINDLLDRTESSRPPRGFEVDQDEKKKRL